MKKEEGGGERRWAEEGEEEKWSVVFIVALKAGPTNTSLLSFYVELGEK